MKFQNEISVFDSFFIFGQVNLLYVQKALKQPNPIKISHCLIIWVWSKEVMVKKQKFLFLLQTLSWAFSVSFGQKYQFVWKK